MLPACGPAFSASGWIYPKASMEMRGDVPRGPALTPGWESLLP